MDFMRTTLKVVAVVTGGALAIAYAPPANAAVPQPHYQTLSHAGAPLSSDELSQVALDLERLFSIYVQQGPDGQWTVNREASAQASLSVPDLERLAANLNAVEQTAIPIYAGSTFTGPDQSAVPNHPFGSEAYKACALDATGLGLFTGLFTGAAGGFWSFIAAKRWADAAWVAARLVGVGALRGRVAGMAAALVGAAAWCATPWAQ